MGLKAILGALALSAVAQLTSPTSAQQVEETATSNMAPQQGSVWLVIHKGWGSQGAMEKIEMADMTQCEMQGAIWKGNKTVEKEPALKYQGFVCLEGK